MKEDDMRWGPKIIRAKCSGRLNDFNPLWHISGVSDMFWWIKGPLTKPLFSGGHELSTFPNGKVFTISIGLAGFFTSGKTMSAGYLPKHEKWRGCYVFLSLSFLSRWSGLCISLSFVFLMFFLLSLSLPSFIPTSPSWPKTLPSRNGYHSKPTWQTTCLEWRPCCPESWRTSKSQAAKTEKSRESGPSSLLVTRWDSFWLDLKICQL